MQASECGYNTMYPNSPNGITDPEYSINVGVQNLAACLSLAKVESPIDMDNIKLCLQGYNFGNGYIPWARDNHGVYTYANGVVNTIEGNSGDRCRQRSYSVGSSSIYGYGVFEY